MIATPVATEFRYVYFMVFALPFYMLTAVLELPDALQVKNGSTEPLTETPADGDSLDG
jgi:hypothetical protein